NKDSKNLVWFTFKAVLITGSVVVVIRFIINSYKETENQVQDTNIETTESPSNDYIEDDSHEYDVHYNNTTVPICPAKPEGARVEPGTGYLFGAEEHVNCKDYCLIDREKELTNKLEAMRREQRIKSLE